MALEAGFQSPPGTTLDSSRPRIYVAAMRRALVAICGFLVAAPAASAGEYTVYACRADEAGRNASWNPIVNAKHLVAYPDGCGSTGDGLVARAGVESAGSQAAAFESAAWRFDAPSGASISKVFISARLYRASGGRWGVGLSNQAGSYLLGGISADALAWESEGYASVVTPGSSSLYFGILCASGAGCPTTSTGQANWGYTRARADLYGARVRVSESSPPAISGVRGALVSGSWVGGRQSVAFDSSDPVGVAGQSYSVAPLAASDAKPCDFARPAPCPTSSGSQFTIDTRGIPDGQQPLTLSAVDAAGNRATWTGTASVDNSAPGPPTPPSLQGLPASRWRSQNGFVLTYENPSRSGGAPLTSRDIQVCPSDAEGAVDLSACSLNGLAGTPGSDTVQLPRPGMFRVRVRVNDALYAGAWSAWSDVLRFDNTAPGTPSTSFPAGWVNAAGASAGLVFSIDPSRVPASGIASYVVDGLPGGARSFTPAVGGAAILPYSLLAEGSTPLTIRAVSGSGLMTQVSRQASGTIRKDTIPPALSVAGAPPSGEKVDFAVTLSANASDSISGMAPAPDNRPLTEGAYVSFAPAEGTQQRFRGASGSISPGDGRHSIGVFAADAAGNLSPETRVAYTQDTRVPTGGLLPAPADTPSMIRFRVSEACPGETGIEISTVPGAWQRLPTSLAGDVASSRVPEPVMSTESPYTLRAQVADCAGNRATLDRWAAGPMAGQPIGELTPPSRVRATVRASFRKPGKTMSGASSRRAVTVEGSARVPDGRPLAGALIVFVTRPRSTGRAWRTLARVKSSRSGRVSRSISNEHSQSIRISVAETRLLAPATSNTLQTSVRATSSIAASPEKLRNGRRVTFGGRLGGGYVPSGFEVALYGRAPGSRSWVPVRTPIAVTRSGRWKAGYRFTRTWKRSRYAFRLRIPARPDYPFSAGYSPASVVTVVP